MRAPSPRQASRRPYAAVSCLECHAPRLLFDAVLSQLREAQARARAAAGGPSEQGEGIDGAGPPATPQAPSKRGMDRVDDFLEKLARLCPLSGAAHYVVLEQAERLRAPRANFQVLLALMRARELAGANVHVVLVSRLGWDSFSACSSTGAAEPMPLAFPAYSDADLVRVLAQMRYPLRSEENGEEESDERRLYARFAGVAIATLARATTSARELHAAVGELWTEALAGPAGAAPWEAPRAAQEAVLLRASKRAGEMLEHGAQCVALGPFPVAREAKAAAGGSGLDSAALPETLELPFVSKLLLLAAHIASRNTASLDSALFTTTGSVRKRPRRSAAAMAKKQEAADQRWLAGPGTFALERMYAVYACIVDAEWGEEGLPASVKEPTSNLLAQVASLAAVNLLATAGGDPLDASARFRCNVGDDVIEAVARQVGFPLHKYAIRQAA